MKIAVSIPDDVFRAGEELAARERCSRSSLYAEALRRLLAEAGRQEVTAKLNAVYEAERSDLGAGLREAQARALSGRR
ncbi:CopG family ribbon-helix-helix protein [Candidatus Poriferisodalis sp.]|uniref:CopG family ribbon-helix-helix protein n=1 Tax=Candidatus Poriferisodalis sp. TaxID=3101277 RepID=UPI003B02AF7D